MRGVVPNILGVKPGINGDSYGCERIACPVGYYNPSGMGSNTYNSHSFLPCKSGSGIYFGSKTCNTYLLKSNGLILFASLFLPIILMTFVKTCFYTSEVILKKTLNLLIFHPANLSISNKDLESLQLIKPHIIYFIENLNI